MIKSLVLLTTYRCNAQCDFCECGPDMAEALTFRDMQRYIDEAESIGTVGQVIFTGGEPSLLGDDLIKAIEYSSSKNLLTRVVTNGIWAKTSEAADRYLDSLISAGLTEINISMDDLHQRWIPLEYAKNAFLACYKRRYKCLIAHKAMPHYRITPEYLAEYFGVELINYDHDKTYSPEDECRLISSGVVVPVGRNSGSAGHGEPAYGNFTKNCSSVLRDIVVGPDHQMLACCGIVTKHLPELTLGDLRHNRMIDLIEEANNDLMLNWLVLEGPAAIAEFVKSKQPCISFLPRYVTACHLCNDLLTRHDTREVLLNHIDEIADRIELHRTFFESVRSDSEMIKMYA
ncbi:MAG: radical SAM protein [Nitrospiraceae bacterium]|nr:radical SAM protein [Nitrospiraceae bacterium]